MLKKNNFRDKEHTTLMKGVRLEYLVDGLGLVAMATVASSTAVAEGMTSSLPILLVALVTWMTME